MDEQQFQIDGDVLKDMLGQNGLDLLSARSQAKLSQEQLKNQQTMILGLRAQLDQAKAGQQSEPATPGAE